MATLRSFGRYHVPDERDHEYPLKAIASKRRSRTWRLGPLLDQEDNPWCVGYSILGLFQSSPRRRTPMSAEGIYRFAQHEDEWIGNEYDGSSVRGGMKAMSYCGLIKEYRWAFDVDTAVNHVLERGPLVVGTNWYTGMNRVDADGYMSVSGQSVGGHAYLIYSANVSRETLKIRNSWGPRFGVNGNACLTFKDFERLLDEDGECCAAIEQ